MINFIEEDKKTSSFIAKKTTASNQVIFWRKCCCNNLCNHSQYNSQHQHKNQWNWGIFVQKLDKKQSRTVQKNPNTHNTHSLTKELVEG